MLGSNGSSPSTMRPKISDVARIDGNLTQVVAGADASNAQVYLNGNPLNTGDLDSLTIEIVAPDANNSQGTITALLSSYQAAPDGSRAQRSNSLFPGTIDIVANGRRVVVTCMQMGSFDGLWLGVGTRADGSLVELEGVGAFRLAVTPAFIDARVTWSDSGQTEDIFIF